MGAVLIWWLTLDIIALAALPLAWRLLRPLPDRGLLLARPLGLLLTGYLFWLLVTLGLLQNTAAGVVAALLGVGGVTGGGSVPRACPVGRPRLAARHLAVRRGVVWPGAVRLLPLSRL